MCVSLFACCFVCFILSLLVCLTHPEAMYVLSLMTVDLSADSIRPQCELPHLVFLYFFYQQQAIEQREQEDYLSGELVEVPDEYKGLVIGKGGETLAKLSKKTGSKVIRKKGEVYIVSGTEEQRRQAKVLIKIMIVS